MYVDFIKAKGNVDECMIVDAEDCNHWASTPEFMVLYIMITDIHYNCFDFPLIDS